jgi:predicted PurR-regulated permease PerM
MSNQAPTTYSGSGSPLVGMNVQVLFQAVTNATVSAQNKLQQLKNNQSSISIGDMFEMQMLMNHLSQLSEMATAVVSALHSAIKSMAQNVRG